MTKTDFVKDSQGYGSHRPLLWEALEVTKMLHLPVLELGSGSSSTPYLYQYCKDNNLEFYSYEYNEEYAKLNAKYGTILTSWHNPHIWNRKYSVALIDESPGEHRKDSVFELWFLAQICVIHDSEPPGWNASDYRVRPLFLKFKYMIDDIPKEKGAPWTTALSNTIDVTKFQL